MANALYDSARQGFLDGLISWSSDNIKVALLDGNDYTPNLATHTFLDVVPVVARVAVSGNLTSKTSAAGVADAGDVTLAGVSGDEAEYILLFQDTGVEATSRLIGLIDQAANLPITPNGGDIQIVWGNTVVRIFKL